MKCTWPMQTICVGDPTQPIFHWLGLGFCVGGYANFSRFGYQHVGIPNAEFCVEGLSQRKDPMQVFLSRSGI